uniref:hypothetical protein n=1 Tax=Micromonospora sp. NBC_00855 TaxID=2975978 RepID=UPI00225ABB7F|nr:hypothetical protein OHB51_35415 [Micromonospora sp. NBC_00855]
MTDTTTNPTSWITKNGVVRVGQLYRDNRDDNIRTLRVDSIEPDLYGDSAKVHYTVISQTYLGQTTEPMRTHRMKVTRITNPRAFVLVPAGDL